VCFGRLWFGTAWFGTAWFGRCSWQAGVRVEIRQLAALVAVADAGSVTAAARQLHVVQPAVTRQVRTLEEELGVALFSRTRHGMTLTAEGERLVERARRALAELETARLEISPAGGAVTGIVRAGLPASLTGGPAQQLAAVTADRYPRIELRILTGYSGQLHQWLERGDLDLSLLDDPGTSASVSVVPLLREQLWAAAPPEAGLAAGRPVSWERLLRHPLVLPVPGHALRTVIDAALADTGREPVLAVQVNSMELQRQLVRGGRGWTVLPASGVAGDIAAGRLSGAPLSGPEVTRPVALGLRPGRAPAPVLAVAAELRQLITDLVRSGAWPAELEPATLEPAQHENLRATRSAGTPGATRRVMGRSR
jgi:LysR family transcriptional regulator, nitrogen assimilation regulatory protein